jgi:hypothetical protein
MFNKYKEYLKDNPQGYWFKRKLYGWGWTPVKWQGVVTILVAVALLVLNGLSLTATEQPSDSMIGWFLARTGLIVIALIAICFKKGEKPRWQWGIPKKE